MLLATENEVTRTTTTPIAAFGRASMGAATLTRLKDLPSLQLTRRGSIHCMLYKGRLILRRT